MTEQTMIVSSTLGTSVSIPLSSSAATQLHLHLPVFQFFTRSLSQTAVSAILPSLLSSLNHAILRFLFAPLVIIHSLVVPTPFSPSPFAFPLNTFSTNPLQSKVFLFTFICAFYLLQFLCPQITKVPSIAPGFQQKFHKCQLVLLYVILDKGGRNMQNKQLKWRHKIRAMKRRRNKIFEPKGPVQLE